MVANICVYAAQEQSKPIAIIVPNEPILKSLAKQNSIDGNNLEELCKSEKLSRVVLKELQAAARQGGLVGVEIVDGVVLADEEWTSANVSVADLFVKRLGLIFSPGLGHCSAENKSERYSRQVPKTS